MNSSLRSLMTAAAWLVFLAAPARADLVVSNLAETSIGSFPLGQIVETNFTTGTTADVLDFVVARLTTSSGFPFAAGTATYTAQIFSDSGGVSDVLLATSATFQRTTTSGQVVTEDAALDFPDLALSANTTYWLRIDRTTTGPGGLWNNTTSDNEATSVGWAIGNTSRVGAFTDPGSAMFSINTVPEPSLAPWLAAALLSAVAVRFWRRPAAR